MPNVLVVYFSETGHTARAAKDVARRLGGDLERILPVASRRKSKLAKMFAALLRREEAVHVPAKDPADYRTVVIATPVWAGRLPPPVRSYLAKTRGHIRDAGFIATSSSAGSAGTLKDLRAAVGRAARAEVTITDADRRSGADAAKLAAFAETFRTGAVAA